ncbi:MAG: TIGR04141 family sporadically distributed protein [Candidatus Muirbacterium halophilum]|nr:TIGR04141 family sporadically distributed protein [Candidatus Muirbacterium halophilum]MCK9477338.1 TIGR04141 family sporadically distributed protein [Candidatus Muirbacterium halophilum]
MAKSRNFSIYLLKEGFNEKNSLKDYKNLDGSLQKVDNLPINSKLFLLKNKPTSPWWKDYWGIYEDLEQVLNGALVFLNLEERCFVLTFGHTYHYLKEDCYEYDFGLRTTLNAIDSKKLKSTDILQPETAKRERIQSPTESELTFFDINNDESIIKKLTGKVKDEYINNFRRITGANNIRISSNVEAKKIIKLCELLYNIYKKDDFKTNFPDIQNIKPESDPEIIEKLNKKLIDNFNKNSDNLFLTNSDILDYSYSYNFKYLGAGGKNNIYEDVFIENYKKYLYDNHHVQNLGLDDLKKHTLNIIDENLKIKRSISIYKSLIFDCEYKKNHYHLCEGEWYYIETDYIKKLKKELDPYFKDSNILIECNQKREDDYNKKTAKDNKIICLDKSNISIKKQTAVEPCDLICEKDGFLHLIHIKISTGSSHLSHLFNQGLNSVELLRMENESREKLKKLVNNIEYNNLIDEQKFKVIYGIISRKDKIKKSDNLPVFSRISLLRTLKRLKLMHIDSEIIFIKDKVERG